MAKPKGVQHWNRWANEDPLFAILSDPQKQGNRWDLADFMATGRRDVEEVLDDIQRLQVPLQMERALDFGCGIGRLSRALADHFRNVEGIDGSREYVRLAREHNTQSERVHFGLSGLSLPFPDNHFDLVLSRLTLQHIPPADRSRYLAEFVRVTRPNGVLAFQILGFRTRLTLKARVITTLPWLYRLFRHRYPRMPLYLVPPERIKARVERLGGVVREVRREADHGGCASFRFIAQKP